MYAGDGRRDYVQQVFASPPERLSQQIPRNTNGTCFAAKVYNSSHLTGGIDSHWVSHVQVVSLGFGPELDLDRTVDGEPDGASIETSCQGRIDARRIIVKREVVGAGMSKSSSREV